MPGESGGRALLRSLRRRWAVLAPVLVTALCYAPYLGKGFVSEDFLLIPLHREAPPWQDLGATFGGPWLGMELFAFYRPFATLAFGAESALFGAWSAGYNAVHLAVHLLATVLVWRLALRFLGPGREEGSGARGEGRPVAAAVAALFFGLYPLAPNSVLFAASFANLFGAAATLAAALLYLRARDGAIPSLDRARTPASEGAPRGQGGAWRYLAAVLAFAVALGCYESAVVLPAWVALYEVTRPGFRAHWRRALAALAGLVVPALGYLGLRSVLLGEALGGYGDLARRLRAADLELLAQVPRSLLRVPSPWLGAEPGPAVETVLAALLLAGAALWLARAPGGMDVAPRRRAFVLGLGWIVAFLAPFAYRLVDPAAGRYWYLPAAGAALAVGALVDRGVVRRRLPRVVVLTVVALLLVRNGWSLQRHLGWMDEAAATAGRVADEVERVAEGVAGGPLFVAGYPLFLEGEDGVRLAQVYHYGLRSALGPPFRTPARDVYPLPPADRADPRRLARERPVWRWVESFGRLERLRPAPERLPPRLDVDGPPDGVRVDPSDPAALALRVDAPRDAWLRLVIVATGNFMVAEPRRTAGDPFLALDGPFLRFWARLQPGPQLWWVERLGTGGAVQATSPPRWLEVDVGGIGTAPSPGPRS